MKISLIGLLILFSFAAWGQTDSLTVEKRKVVYFNNVLAGGLFGESGQESGLSLSTTHGIRWGRMALGAGVGFDSYLHWKAVPFFGSISVDLARIKQNAFYFQINAGNSFAEKINRETWLFDYREYGSTMIGTTAGYRINTDKLTLYIAAGHKFQRVHYSYNPSPWSSEWGGSTFFVEEDMNRFLVQIGFGWH